MGDLSIEKVEKMATTTATKMTTNTGTRDDDSLSKNAILFLCYLKAFLETPHSILPYLLSLSLTLSLKET